MDEEKPDEMVNLEKKLNKTKALVDYVHDDLLAHYEKKLNQQEQKIKVLQGHLGYSNHQMNRVLEKLEEEDRDFEALERLDERDNMRKKDRDRLYDLEAKLEKQENHVTCMDLELQNLDRDMERKADSWEVDTKADTTSMQAIEETIKILAKESKEHKTHYGDNTKILNQLKGKAEAKEMEELAEKVVGTIVDVGRLQEGKVDSEQFDPIKDQVFENVGLTLTLEEQLSQVQARLARLESVQGMQDEHEKRLSDIEKKMEDWSHLIAERIENYTQSVFSRFNELISTHLDSALKTQHVELSSVLNELRTEMRKKAERDEQRDMKTAVESLKKQVEACVSEMEGVKNGRLSPPVMMAMDQSRGGSPVNNMSGLFANNMSIPEGSSLPVSKSFTPNILPSTAGPVPQPLLRANQMPLFYCLSCDKLKPKMMDGTQMGPKERLAFLGNIGKAVDGLVDDPWRSVDALGRAIPATAPYAFQPPSSAMSGASRIGSPPLTMQLNVEERPQSEMSDIRSVLQTRESTDGARAGLNTRESLRPGTRDGTPLHSDFGGPRLQAAIPEELRGKNLAAARERVKNFSHVPTLTREHPKRRHGGRENQNTNVKQKSFKEFASTSLPPVHNIGKELLQDNGKPVDPTTHFGWQGAQLGAKQVSGSNDYLSRPAYVGEA